MRSHPYRLMPSHPVRGFFGVAVWPQSYLNILYLALGFPIGLAWFLLYVVGGALGIGLLVVLVGAVLLLLLVLVAQWLGALERLLAVHVLGVPIQPGHTVWREDEGLGRYLGAALRNRTTWTGLIFLLARFPLGLASWLVFVVVGSVILALIGAPIAAALGADVNLGAWRPDTTAELLMVSLIGVALVVPALHLFNGIAWLWGRFARLMLGGRRPAPGRPREAPAPLNRLPSPQPVV